MDSRPRSQEVPAALKVRSVPAWDLPRELMEQKPGWDLDLFYEWAGWNHQNLLAFVFEEAGRDIGCFWMTCSPVYRTAIIDTFVIDKELREPERVKRCVRVAFEIARQAAKEAGMRRLTWSSVPKLAERFIDYLDGDIKHLETVVGVEWDDEPDPGEASE